MNLVKKLHQNFQIDRKIACFSSVCVLDLTHFTKTRRSQHWASPLQGKYGRRQLTSILSLANTSHMTTKIAA